MKLFFKKLGIMLVPAIVTILVLVVFDMMFDMSWNIDYPDKDPLQPIAEIAYRGSIHAISRVLFGTIVAVWVFCNLMNWAKKKIAKMMKEDAQQRIARLVGNGDGDGKNNGDGNGDGNGKSNGDGNGSLSPEQKKEIMRLEYASNFTLDIARIDWHLSKRYFFAYIGGNTTFAMLNVDLPGEHPDDTDHFWCKCDAFIHGFWVCHQAYNHGLGSHLLIAAENLCKGIGRKTVALRYDDRESEPWVLEWYKRRGYEEKFLEGDGHSHFLVKKLTDEKPADENPADENKKDGENQE